MRFLFVWCVAMAAWAADGYVASSGTGFVLNGQPYHASGTNCYYLTYKSPGMVDAALADAQAMGLRVVRVWGFLDCGNGNPANGVLPTGNKDGVYFQYKDTATGTVKINDGADGLARLDYVIDKAAQLGLKVTVSLTNNWGDFGGMDQYLAWHRGNSNWYHDEFYSDATIRQAYKDYVAHILNRTNSRNGRLYKNDPTIFSWELANEPRCKNGAGHDRLNVWTMTTIRDWANVMAGYIQSIDANHMVAVGDEGFFNRGIAADWTYNGVDGVDHEALTALHDIDYASFHLYPDNWGKDVAWGTQWITAHCLAAASLGKPTVLGEYGYEVPKHSEAERMAAYTVWGDTLRTNGGDGSWFWMIGSYDPIGPGLRYEDYDHFTTYLDGIPWRAGQAIVDDDDVIAAQAWALHGIDNRPPQAMLALSSVSGMAPLLVTGNGSGSTDPDGQVLTYAWNFGDGTIATGVAPNHTYTQRGTYIVTLTVSDPYGMTATASQTVYATNRAPLVTASAPVTDGSGTLAVLFSATASDADGDVMSYAWNFGDGATSPAATNGANPQHSYGVGTYTSTVTADDGHGASATATVTIRVAPAGGSTGGTSSTSGSTPASDGGSSGGCGAGQGLALLLSLSWCCLRFRRRNDP